MLRILTSFLLFATISWAAFPTEDYKNSLIVLVHGVEGKAGQEAKIWDDTKFRLFLSDEMGIASEYVHAYQMSDAKQNFWSVNGGPSTSRELGDNTYINPAASSGGLDWLDLAKKDYRTQACAKLGQGATCNLDSAHVPQKFVLVGHGLEGTAGQ